MNYSLLRDQEDLSRVLVHELTHAVTSDVIENYENPTRRKHLTAKQIKGVEEINNILTELRKDKKFKNEYGITDADELLAELANDRFVKKLKAKRYKGTSVLNKIVQAVLDIVGVTNYRDRLMNSMMDIIDDFTVGKFAEDYASQLRDKRIQKGITLEKELAKPEVLAFMHKKADDTLMSPVEKKTFIAEGKKVDLTITKRQQDSTKQSTEISSLVGKKKTKQKKTEG
jgi:hypothetical protein